MLLLLVTYTVKVTEYIYIHIIWRYNALHLLGLIYLLAEKIILLIWINIEKLLKLLLLLIETSHLIYVLQQL